MVLTFALLMSGLALASEVRVAVVDVNLPIGSVTLAPGGETSITIDLIVTGNQAGTATFEVYRDWTLSDGTFNGRNPQEFTVPPRASSDPATTFSTSGKVAVAAGHASGGPLTLAVGAFDITNSNTTGAKLAAGASSNYRVTVSSPAPPTDTTPPVITLTTPPADGAVYVLNEPVVADYECTDGQSAVTTCSGTVADGDWIDTSTVGGHSFTVDASSAGGDSDPTTHAYTVVYNSTGFDRPVDNGDTLNRLKAGQAVPLKWRLTDYYGVPVTSLSSATVRASTAGCTAGTPVDTLEQVASGSSGLQNLGDGYYQYNWKTPTTYANSCRIMTLDLGEGEGAPARTALFQFSK